MTGWASSAIPTRFSLLCSCAVLVLLCCWVYWPGISGPELLDDRSSIMVIKGLGERPELAWDYIFGDRSGPLGRTVSLATFVAEKIYLEDTLASHKRINILLHAANGLLVVWLFLLLFDWQRVPGCRALAVILGAIWLFHPLQVSTVLYVVQRMAMLATFFMLLSLIAYLLWRSRVRHGNYHLLGLAPVGVFLCLGLLSKENAVLILPVILLVEVLWLRCRDKTGALLLPLQRVAWGLIALGTMTVSLLLLFNLDYLEARTQSRPFSFEERVLSQPRILWDYVGQWFWPQVERMGIYHDDYIWSRSLGDPESTMWAIGAWLAVLVICALLFRWQNGKLLVLCIAWFIVGHAMESTVWPLELYFEHRNYFPAMGLVLLVGVLYVYVVRLWQEVQRPLLAWYGLVPLMLVLLTSSQVLIWSSRPMLIAHHLNGHPDSSRANLDMASHMASLGSIEKAHYYSRRAFEVSHVEREGDWAVRDIALSCVAKTPVSRTEIERIGAVDVRRPLSSTTTLLTLVRLVQEDKCLGLDKQYFADHLAGIFLRPNAPATAATNIYSNLAVLENALSRYDKAFAYTEKLLQRAPNHKRGLLMHLHFATALGKPQVAAETIDTLQAMDQKGKLNQREQATLALYL